MGAHCLLLYMGAGLAGAALRMVVDLTSTSPPVGASGAVFGVLAACAKLRARSLVLGNILALILPESTFAMHGVAVHAHVGGLAFGFVATLVMRVEAPRADVDRAEKLTRLGQRSRAAAPRT